MLVIPKFQTDGNLPPGLYAVDWGEFYHRFGTNEHRRRLLAGLKAALDNLREAGCCTAYIDGSFATSKELPLDFDGCWDVTGVDPARIDPILLTFDRGRAAQKAKYQGELFPSIYPANPHGDTFLDFFRQDRNGNQKGIIALDLRRLP